VVHRDLKPENILLQQGQPVVLDFGIALAMKNASGARMTQTGITIGTPQYMSPEQAAGEKTIDARADIYALGALLYAMLVGEPPHTGPSVQAIIAKVMLGEVRPITSSRPSVPQKLAAAAHKALALVPADRFSSADEFARALHDYALPQASEPPRKNVPRLQTHSRKWQFISGVLGLVVLMFATWTMVRPGSDVTPEPGRFSIEIPDSLHVYVGEERPARTLAVDWNGTQLAMVLEANAKASRAIYLRRLDDVALQRVSGTDSAVAPAFSHDGASIAFLVGSTIKSVPVGGGTPRVLAENAGSFSWGDDGSVVFARDRSVFRVPTGGGEAKHIAGPDSAARRFIVTQPHMLPGSKYALVTILQGADALDSARLSVLSLEDGTFTDLGVLGASPRYDPAGFVVFARFTNELFAAAFDASTRKLSSAPVRLAEQVMTSAIDMTVDVALSGTGMLAYQHTNRIGVGPAQLFAVDRAGREIQLSKTAAYFRQARISPDGKRVVARIHPSTDVGDLWVFDVEHATQERLTSDTLSLRGEWTRDGTRVVYLKRYGDSVQVRSRSSNTSGPDSVLARGTFETATGINEIALARNSENVALRIGSSATNPDIWIARLDALDKRQPLSAAQSAAIEVQPAISPDGQLVAFTSYVSGAPEVHLASVSGTGARVVVSLGGGTEPMWSSDGRTLFYRGPKHMMAASVAAARMGITRRDTLFVDRYERYTFHQAYDVFPGGQRFLMTRRVDNPNEVSGKIRIVTHWPELAKRLGARAGVGEASRR